MTTRRLALLALLTGLFLACPDVTGGEDASASADGAAATDGATGSDVASGDAAEADAATGLDPSDAPVLGSSHPGWQQPNCLTAGCHSAATLVAGHDSTWQPFDCAGCHGGNGARHIDCKSGHNEGMACLSCHGQKHGFQAKAECLSCHQNGVDNSSTCP